MFVRGERLSQIGFECDDGCALRFCDQSRERAVTRADVEYACAGRDRVECAQERHAEEAAEDVEALGGGVVAEGPVQQSERVNRAERHRAADYSWSPLRPLLLALAVLAVVLFFAKPA